MSYADPDAAVNHPAFANLQIVRCPTARRAAGAPGRWCYGGLVAAIPANATVGSAATSSENDGGVCDAASITRSITVRPRRPRRQPTANPAIQRFGSRGPMARSKAVTSRLYGAFRGRSTAYLAGDALAAISSTITRSAGRVHSGDDPAGPVRNVRCTAIRQASAEQPTGSFSQLRLERPVRGGLPQPPWRRHRRDALSRACNSAILQHELVSRRPASARRARSA